MCPDPCRPAAVEPWVLSWLMSVAALAEPAPPSEDVKVPLGISTKNVNPINCLRLPRISANSLARSEGFEPPTLGIEIRCSIQLSYERPGPGIGPRPKNAGPSLANQRTGRRSDAFELAERLANKKPFPPPARRIRAGSHQVVLKRPKCGCWATSIIGRPGCCGAGCARTTLRLG